MYILKDSYIMALSIKGGRKMVEKRNVGKAIVFTILTCGIYGAYWFVKMTDDSRELSDDYAATSGVLALIFNILTVGIYGIYWSYVMGKRIYSIQERYKIPADDRSVLYIIISILGFQVINIALMQSDINYIIDMKRGLREGNEWETI